MKITASTKTRQLLLLGTLCAMFAVILGAFAAHGLEAVLDANGQQRFATGTEYHFYHAFGIILVALSLPHAHHIKYAYFAAWSFFIGIILFSGSLYLLAISNIKAFAMITPFGGFAFIIGWLLFALSVWKPAKF